MTLRKYISPYFLSRIIRYRDIKDFCDQYKFKGRLIDIGCGSKPYKNLFTEVDRYEGIDFKDYSVNKDFPPEKPEYFFESNYTNKLILPFKTNSYDVAVSFQVLEHHRNPELFISELSRVTKKGSYLMLTFPFIGGLHEEPHDYQRYTKYGIEELLGRHNFKLVKIRSQGNSFMTIVMLWSEKNNHVASKGGLYYLLGAFLHIFNLGFQYLSLLFYRDSNQIKMPFNYIVLAKNEKK